MVSNIFTLKDKYVIIYRNKNKKIKNHAQSGSV